MARGSLVDEVALLRSGVWAGIGRIVRIVERTRTPSAGGITFRRRQLTGPCSSVVEHTLGKGEVVSSILTMGSGYRIVESFRVRQAQQWPRRQIACSLRWRAPTV